MEGLAVFDGLGVNSIGLIVGVLFASVVSANNCASEASTEAAISDSLGPVLQLTRLKKKMTAITLKIALIIITPTLTNLTSLKDLL